jgi:hypothetical protein
VTRARPVSEIRYALETLYEDQDPRWVIHTLPALIAWLRKSSPRPRQPYVFAVDHVPAAAAPARPVRLALRWSIETLAKRDPNIQANVVQYETGATVHREHIAEIAAYGLALVAISVLLPGERVVDMPAYAAPDMLLDDTPGSLRGVEVAGRSSGGRAALRLIRTGGGAVGPGKAKQLLALPDVVEVHLSLWCASPRVSEMRRLKP